MDKKPPTNKTHPLKSSKSTQAQHTITRRNADTAIFFTDVPKKKKESTANAKR